MRPRQSSCYPLLAHSRSMTTRNGATIGSTMRLDDDTRRRLSRAREMLAHIADESPSVAAVAREVGVSPFHFIRVFDRVFGVTPHQYRVAARIDRARVLL